MINQKWHKMYLLSKKYYEKNNNLLIPGTYTLFIDGKEMKLGKWIIIQRYLKGSGKLEEEKIKLLNQINMIWDLNQSKWMNNYKYAKKYYNAYHDLNMPSCYEIISLDGKVINLHNWINEQKKNYKTGNLSDKQKSLLDEIGVKINRKNILSWNESYLLAKEYYDTYGNLRISTDYKVLNKDGRILNLYTWLNNQRLLYKENKLSKEKIELLNKINISWTFDEDKISPAWYKNYYYAKMFYKNNVLNEKQIQLLNNIHMIWSAKKSSVKNYKDWNKNYELAKEYYNIHKNLLIPFDYKVKDENSNEVLLGGWIQSQRHKYKQGKLSDECIWLLNNIKMIWDVRYNKWDIYYEELKRFKETYGDLFVPENYLFKYEDDVYDLHFWLENQKKLLNARKNSNTRKYFDMLDKLGIIWDDITDEILSKYLIDEYNKYINDIDVKKANGKNLAYKDMDVNYFKKMIRNRKGNANK